MYDANHKIFMFEWLMCTESLPRLHSPRMQRASVQYSEINIDSFHFGIDHNTNLKKQLFSESPTQRDTGSQLGGYGFGGCGLTGITLSHGRNLSNLGTLA